MGYKTIKGEAFGEFTEKRSRFICYGKHVENENQAENYVDSIRSKHWDAKHNVYAYIVKNGNVKKSSDDGEPRGTAGAPALMRLEGMGVEDAVIVVTRYFGGVLLGTGGLVRAYSRGAQVAVEACGLASMESCIVLEIHMSYEVFGKAEGNFKKFGAVIADRIYTDAVDIVVKVEENKFDRLKRYLEELSCGRVEFRIKGKEFCAIDGD